MTQEVLKLALEALEWCHGGEPCGTTEAITAIKEALAQPPGAKPHEQEPDDLTVWRSRALQAEAVIDKFMAQSQQEPLEYWNAVEGWVKIDEVRKHFDSVGCGTIYKTSGEGREPLYTTPPQRKPLTDEEIYMNCPAWLSQDQCKTWVRQIEAAHGITAATQLKE